MNQQYAAAIGPLALALALGGCGGSSPNAQSQTSQQDASGTATSASTDTSAADPLGDQSKTGALSIAVPALKSPVALPIQPSNIPNRSVQVTDYGATPNDGSDDTLAIQRAIDAVADAGGGTVRFPGGRYDISIQPKSSGRPYPQALLLRSKLRLAALDSRDPATLRLADAQGNYESIMGTANFGDSLDDFILEDLTIDANGAGNPVLRPSVGDKNSPDFANDLARSTLRVYKGSRILVQRNRFLNAASVWVLAFIGDPRSASDVDVLSNRFEGMGNVGADYDHSTIYTRGPRMRVSRNTFVSARGAGTLGVRTAIETHGDDQTVTSNKISGFVYGINAVGDQAGGARHLYAYNTIEEVSAGIVIWSLLGDRTPRDKSFSEVMIFSNSIAINLDDWRRAALAFGLETGAGISLETANEAPIDDLGVVSNRIRFTKAASVSSAYFALRSAGISFDLFKNPAQPIRNLQMTGNVIENSPGPGMFIGVPLQGAWGSLLVNGNTIINPIRGNELRYQAAAPYRAGIYFANATSGAVALLSRNINVAANRVSVTAEGAGPLTFGVNALTACETSCTIRNTTVSGTTAPAVSTGTGWSVIP